MPVEKIQGKLVQQRLHNDQVLKNIESINTFAQQHSSTQLIQELHKWHQSPPHLTVTNTLFWSLMGVAALLFALLLFIQVMPWLYLIVLGIVAFAFYKKENNKKRDQLLGFLKYKTLSEKYALDFDQNALPYSISDLMSTFPSFNLGNYSNEIQDIAAGTFHTEQQDFPFTLYRYHYVEEVRTRDKDNNVTKHYHHYDRWGVFIGQMPITGLSISTNKLNRPRFKHVWTTSDIAFNKKYYLSGTSELELAKFFNPARVLALDPLLSQFGGELYFHPNIPVLGWQFGTDIFQHSPQSITSNTVFELAQKLETLEMKNFAQFRKNAEHLLSRIQ